MIDEVRELQEHLKTTNGIYAKQTRLNDGTLTEAITAHHQEETIIPEAKPSHRYSSIRRQDTETESFQSSSCNTMIELSSESSDTMIINENGTETENDADSQQDTLKVRAKDLIWFFFEDKQI